MFKRNREAPPHLFLYHAVLRVITLEVEAEEAGSVEHVLKVPETDLPERFVDSGHERGHCPLREVDHLGRRLLYTCGDCWQVSKELRSSNKYVNRRNVSIGYS